MGDYTGIEWCDHTFNPWWGCTKISPGCDHCYAETWAKRAGRSDLWAGKLYRTSGDNWKKPRQWNKAAAKVGMRARVFCASMADVFDNQAPEEWRWDLWEMIAECRNLDWLILTKRPVNIRKMLPANFVAAPWRHVFLGVTAENQEEADRRLPHLLATPAAVRFISCEPLLGPIHPWHHLTMARANTIRGAMLMDAVLPGIDWVIAGGESGPGARPMHPSWVRDLRDQCKATGVPFFFKQMGGPSKAHMPPIPDDMMVREFPVVAPRDPATGRLRSSGALLDGRAHREMPT